MRALLIGDNKYQGMEAVQFPVEVTFDPDQSNVSSIGVPVSELERIGCDIKKFAWLPHYSFPLEGHPFYEPAAQILES